MIDETTAQAVSEGITISDTWQVLLSGAVGALAVALLTTLYDRVKAWLDRRRERKALLLLVEDEIDFNNVMLEAFDQDPSIINTHTVSTLSTEAWNSSKIRLAQILSTEHIAVLVTYYSRIRFVKQTVTYRHEHASEKVFEQKRFPVILNSIRLARGGGGTAKNLGQKHLRNREWLKGKSADNS